MEYLKGLEIMNRIYLGNTLFDYLWSLLIILAGIIIIKILRESFYRYLHKLVKRFSISLDDLLYKSLAGKFFSLLYLLVFYIAWTRLNFGDRVNQIIKMGLLIFLLFYSTIIIQKIIIYFLDNYWDRETENGHRKNILSVMTFIIKISIWLIAIIFFLDNLGIEISGLIAGLGIGGIALAFSAQAILGDLFSYVTIFLDRPFEIGDFIIINEYMGTVEQIGIKSTKIRSLSGEQLIIANRDLTESRVRNFKRMERRRIKFNFGILYRTELEKVKQVPEILREIIADLEKVEFDRAHFASFGEYSLVYEVAYYVLSGDYKEYMNIQQKLNLKIMEEFRQNNIEFAYPTKKLFVENIKNIEK